MGHRFLNLMNSKQIILENRSLQTSFVFIIPKIKNLLLIGEITKDVLTPFPKRNKWLVREQIHMIV